MGLFMMNNNLEQINTESQLSFPKLKGLLFPKIGNDVRKSLLKSKYEYLKNRGARVTDIKTGSKNRSVPVLKLKNKIQKTQSTKWVHFEPHIVASCLLE